MKPHPSWICIFLIASVVALGTPVCAAQSVFQIAWPTRKGAPPPAFPKPASDFLPAFRAGLAVLPESEVVALALSQPAFLGLTPDSANELRELCARRYRIILNDPVFGRVPSALPYCYSPRTPTNGLALVYRPKETGTNTHCLLFLHGFGGSFLWTPQLLSEAFPDHIIICPAYGVSTALIQSDYVSECLAAVEGSVGHSLARPSLIGLSAGGFGATRIYTQSPDRFRQLVVIAAYPPPETLGRFNRKTSVHFIVGAHEDYVLSGAFDRNMQSIRPRSDHFESYIIPNANHFFVLSHQDEAFKVLHRWLDLP